jgi:tRNA(Ile)-lysidine synthase
MRAKRRVPQGFEVVRPCLDMGRDELRHYLRVLQGPWVEDPSNEDWAYDRARVRALLPQLQEIGLTVDRLAGTAGRMARAKVALQEAAVTAWDSIGAEGRLNDVPLGDVQFGCDGFAAQPQDTQLRLLAGALCYVSGQPNRPRSEPLEALLERLLSGGGGTLHGCEVTSEKQIFRVFREYAALAPSIDPGCPGVWDGRWHVSGLGVGRTVGPLGEDGWALVPAAAKAGLPFKLARSLPCSRGAPGEPLVCPAFGVFAQGQTLEVQAAAPTGNLAVEHEEFDYRPMGKPGLTFREFLLSH